PYTFCPPVELGQAVNKPSLGCSLLDIGGSIQLASETVAQTPDHLGDSFIEQEAPVGRRELLACLTQ
ncbi:hypothetical protein ACEN88_35660, partial [Massilia sp. CT11-108]|uniref:hypothetical protein n=1 Tax=Massilia sp. CT11-108 TaxID=3393900 RepID=UPI0039A69F26